VESRQRINVPFVPRTIEYPRACGWCWGAVRTVYTQASPVLYYGSEEDVWSILDHGCHILVHMGPIPTSSPYYDVSSKAMVLEGGPN
jgi:hypothetical protein